MGSPRSTARFLLGRHDAQDLVHETGHMRARSAGSLQGDLHHQVVAHRTGNGQREHEPDSGQCFVRLDGPSLGRGTWHLHSYADQAHGARLLGGVQSGRQVPGVGQLRQMRSHLEHTVGSAGAQLQGNGRHLRGVLELARQQGRSERFGRQRVRARSAEIVIGAIGAVFQGLAFVHLSLDFNFHTPTFTGRN